MLSTIASAISNIMITQFLVPIPSIYNMLFLHIIMHIQYACDLEPHHTMNSYATILKPAIDVVSKHHNTYACDIEPHRHIAISHFEFDEIQRCIPCIIYTMESD